MNIRKSLARVRAEVTAMDVRVGVLEHTLLQVLWCNMVWYCMV